MRSIDSEPMNSPLHSTLQVIQSTLSNLDAILTIKILDLHQCSQSEYEAIRTNRAKYYKQHAPHLLTEDEQATEYSVDQKSLIFYIQNGTEVLASLRITARPFELESMTHGHFDFSKYDKYFEIGRLVTDPELDVLTSALIIKYLMCTAGLKAFSELGAAGLVAICRPFRKSLFNKFGLSHLAEIYSAERKIYYCFLAGSMNDILANTAELQNNEQLFRRRLQRSFQQRAQSAQR